MPLLNFALGLVKYELQGEIQNGDAAKHPPAKRVQSDRSGPFISTIDGSYLYELKFNLSRR